MIITYIHPLNGPLSGTTQVSRYQKDKSNLDFTGARDSGWQWHQLGHMQVCTSLQTDNHASTPPLSFLQAGCPSCRPTNSVKALKAEAYSPLQVKWSSQLSCGFTAKVAMRLSQLPVEIETAAFYSFPLIHHSSATQDSFQRQGLLIKSAVTTL